MKIYFHSCSTEIQEFCESWIAEWQSGKEYFHVQTSGSTGPPKSVSLTREQLEASAKRSNEFFELHSDSNILLCISPTTIGARMLLIRALIAESTVHVVQPASKITLPETPVQFDFVSLVPMQLQNLPEADLCRFRTCLVGGAPMSLDMEKEFDKLHSGLFFGFGMTETVSHVAMRRFGETSYSALKGVSFKSKNGKLVITDDVLRIADLQTNDLVELNGPKEFVWLGRADFAINTGGVKVHPEMVEREIGRFFQGNFLLSALPDVTFGEKVILVTETKLSEKDWSALREFITSRFGKYAQPKNQVEMPIPLNTAGKIDRMKTKELLALHRI